MPITHVKTAVLLSVQCNTYHSTEDWSDATSATGGRTYEIRSGENRSRATLSPRKCWRSCVKACEFEVDTDGLIETSVIAESFRASVVYRIMPRFLYTSLVCWTGK